MQNKQDYLNFLEKKLKTKSKLLFESRIHC